MAETQMQTDIPTPQDAIDTVKKDWPGRWANINKILDRRGPFCDPGFIPGHGEVLSVSFMKLVECFVGN